ncbi:MAG: ABC transporter permease, partial [Planctomycetota bacterium]|nr:ABC transporter permease [Planctomycetota bacterium]
LSRIVTRNLRRRPLATVLTSFSVALGVALFSTVGAVRRASEEGFQRSAAICDLVVGPKGSSLELVLNSLYHMGQSQGNIPFSVLQSLNERPGVEWTIPSAVGDSYRGYRVVGVTDELFSRAGLSVQNGESFSFSTEDLIRERTEGHHDGHEVTPAVIGSLVAKDLSLGAEFFPSHNLREEGGAEEHHDSPTKVIGELAATGTPMDRAIFIPLSDFYAIDGHKPTKESSAGGTRDPLGLSSIFLRTKPGFHHIRIWRDLNDRLDTQAARPADQVRKLFEIIGGVDRALRLVAALVMAVALIGVLVAIYNTMGARKKEFAILRALGAGRQTVLAMVVAESAGLAAFGGLMGLFFAGAGTWAASGYLQTQTGVLVSAIPGLSELQLLLGVIIVGGLAGLVPALSAYRTEAAKHLASTN